MKVVDIAALSKNKELALKSLEVYMEDVIIRNADQISHTILNRGTKETPRDVLLLYVNFFLGHGISQYDREMLIELVSSGVIFQARELFIDKMLEDSTISMTLDSLIEEDCSLLIG